MSAKEVLFTHVHRVRWRMRVQAGLQDAVLGILGTALGLMLLAAWTVWKGTPPMATKTGAAGVALSVALVTAILASRRRIDLVVCARALDSAIDSTMHNADRTVVALELAGSAGTPFVDEVLSDAAGRLDAGSAKHAVPIKAPKLSGLAVGSIVLAAFWAQAAGRPPRFQTVMTSTATETKADAKMGLSAMRTLLQDVLVQARKNGDRKNERLITLALDVLNQAEGVGPETTKARLTALTKLSDDLVKSGGRSGGLFEALTQVLQKDPTTRAAAEAVRRFDAEAIGRRFDELAATLHKAPVDEREEAAATFAEAAGLGQNAAPDTLATAAAAAAPEAEPERELKRLERALDDVAQDCEKDPDACATSVKKAGAELAAQAAQAQEGEDRARVNQALKDAIQKITGEQKDPPLEGAGAGVKSRAGDSSGTTPSSQAGVSRLGSAQKSGTPTPMKSVAEHQAGVVPRMVGADRAGNDPGDAPLGHKTSSVGKNGKDEHVELPTAEGLSRAQVIAGGANGRVQGNRYERVFRDYAAVVEDTLDTTAVPVQRREMVRRYFDLISPRTEGAQAQ